MEECGPSGVTSGYLTVAVSIPPRGPNVCVSCGVMERDIELPSDRRPQAVSSPSHRVFWVSVW